uniref:FYVE-type domain-containing protein n=1 Tax=Globisporangium ultimum (strain ATCC 200006 / CBS 805.95 / DAOM BR144) TaxID=431595 RepID=K3WD86_GLOUD
MAAVKDINAPPRVVIEDENAARTAGRAFAKQIFTQMQWKRIGTKHDEHAKLYESVANGTASANGRYCVRAVRTMDATMREMEVVLARIARDGSLAALLLESYLSGGAVLEYGQVVHQTGEREHVSIQYASLRPYVTGTLGMENHVLLGYSLATMLQRTRKNKSGESETVAVPSVLHLLRPVDFPELAKKKKRDFQREYLSPNDFSITYIIQEHTPATATKPGKVTLEVMLTCTDEDFLGGRRAPVLSKQKGGLSQKQRMWQDALSLTRVHHLVESYRLNGKSSSAVSTTSSTTSSSRRTATNSQNGSANDANVNGSGAPSTSTGCCICHKKFSPFRWKHRCEVCTRAACDRCLSVIANPAVTRRKKRVCSNCLYGPSGIGGGAPAPPVIQYPQAPHVADAPSMPQAPGQQPQPQQQSPERRCSAPNQCAAPQQQPPMSDSMPSSAASEVRPSATTTSRRYSAPATRTTRSGSRPMPPPIPEYDRLSKRYSSRSSRTNSASSSQFFSDSEDDDGFQLPSSRNHARRAQTVTIDEVHCTPVMERKRSFRMAPSYRNSYSTQQRRRPTEQHDDFHDLRLTTLSLAEAQTNSSYFPRLNLHQLKTPEANYDFDFDWLNIFPKAPVPALENERIHFMESLLKMDPHSIVFLRHDSVLEQQAHRVLDLATQWHGCSINVVSRSHVYCLINASSEMDATTGKPAVAVDDVVPREESASSYAVYHNTPFFVSELSHDVRFHAHPLLTDHNAVSFLSFPIYASIFSSTDQVQCIGTLDLWKLDYVAASSHVSQDWWQKMEALAREIGTRVEELARESSLYLKPRTAKANSMDSSSTCDSRGSTWRDDSFELDLFDLENEGNPSLYASPMDSFRVNTTRSFSVSDGRSWKYYSSSNNDDSDNESTTSSCSNSSRTSRTSRSSRYSARYSAADLHSAIESLLHQANETSSMVYQNGVAI